MILDKWGIHAKHDPQINNKINPYGSFETGNFENLPDGCSVKCLTANQLFDLPIGEYKVIMPVRDSEQIILSRREAFHAKQPVRNLDLQKKMIDKQYKFIRFIVEHREDMELLEVPYDDYFNKTDETIQAISDFVGVPFDTEKAKEAIDPTYYKIRK